MATALQGDDSFALRLYHDCEVFKVKEYFGCDEVSRKVLLEEFRRHFELPEVD